MGEALATLIILIFGGSVAAGSVRIVNQGDEAVVESLGRYSGK